MVLFPQSPKTAVLIFFMVSFPKKQNRCTKLDGSTEVSSPSWTLDSSPVKHMVEICLTSSSSPGEDGIEADHAQNPAEGTGMPALTETWALLCLGETSELEPISKDFQQANYMILAKKPATFLTCQGSLGLMSSEGLGGFRLLGFFKAIIFLLRLGGSTSSCYESLVPENGLWKWWETS